jgi:hypothetical protein
VTTTAAVAANSLANASSVSNGAVRVESIGDFEDDYDDSIPETIEADEISPPRRVTVPLEVPPPRSPGREDSGLRMIGSHGRDRAEASGELVPMGSTPPPLTTTQRELVTILPRRITRELQVISADALAGAGNDETVVAATAPAAAKGTDAAAKGEAAAKAEGRAERRSEARPSTPPVELPPAPKRVTEGSGVRRKSGPSGGAVMLLALAAILAGLAVYMRLRKTKPADHVAIDAGMIATPVTPDATEPAGMDAGEIVEATTDAGVMVVDDAAVAVGADAARDAAVTDQATKLAEDSKQSKVLMDQANDALQEGDFELALKQANASLKLRRTARAHLVKAQALQRLSRVDEALASIDSAEALSPAFPLVFELRGRILWAARREDEARVAFEKFLELSPNGATAAQIRRLLDRPR